MKVAVFSNARTTVSAQKNGWTACFNTAFRAGAVMGFALCAAGLLMLYITMLAFRQHYPEPKEWILLTESITGYGLGGSVIAMVRLAPNMHYKVSNFTMPHACSPYESFLVWTRRRRYLHQGCRCRS